MFQSQTRIIRRLWHRSPRIGERTFSGQSSEYRVAVVGAGPGGFYSAKYLLSGADNVTVDMYEKLPVPYGLVRFGVAPDHQDTKSVQNDFNKVAGHDRFRFVGNVELGADVGLSELQKAYNGVILAYGAAGDKDMRIRGEELSGVHSARAFVGWYNGLPELANLEFDLSGDTAVIVGNGNVAIDVARILCSPIDELRKTDICEHALEALAESRIRKVVVLGRRGPIQAAFTIKETRELLAMPGCVSTIQASDLLLNKSSKQEMDKQRALQRKFKLLQTIAVTERESMLEDDFNDWAYKSIALRFFLSPNRFVGGPSGRVESVECERTELVGEPGKQRCVSTGESLSFPASIVFKSVGYKSLPVKEVPFDEQNAVVPSSEGRVQSQEGATEGLYVSGWLKRGPSGIIGTNIVDARQTVKSVLQDMESGILGQPKEAVDVQSLVGGTTSIVTGEGWSKIDHEEKRRGEELGKPREKLVDLEEMVKVAMDN